MLHRKNLRWLLASFVVFELSFSLPSKAQFSVDQSFTSPINLSAGINGCCAFVAQTYTAGKTGTLAGVSVDVISASAFRLHVAIRTVAGGIPTTTVLGEVTLSSNASDLSQIIVFPQSIPQMAGVQYAIVVNYPGAPPGQDSGSWLGATGNAYAGGGLGFSSDGGSSFFGISQTFDVHFKTFVSGQSQVFPKWTARFDARKQNDAPVAMATDASGNVFVTGSACIGVNCADQEAVTIKYDPQGNVLWKAWLTSPVGVASGIDIGVDSAGNSYVLFQFMRQIGFGINGNFPEVVTAKYSSAGVRQWINFIDSFGEPDVGRQRSPSHIAVSPLGNVYISYFEFLNASISDSVAQKYDTNGNTVWSRKQTSVQNAFAEFLGLDGHENVYAVVALQGEQDGPDFTTIFKYDSNGNLLNTFPSNPFLSGAPSLGDVQAFHVDSLGASYLAGLLFSSAPCCLRPPPNRVVAKFNPDGTSAWLVNLDQPTIDPNRRFAAITADRVGNTFVAQTISGTGSGTDISVIKFDTTGQQKFLTRFNGHSDDSGKDQAVALTVNSFSEPYVTGQSAGVTDHPEFATIKYDSLGNLQWVERYVGPGESSDIPVAMTISGGSLIVTGTSIGSGTAQDWATINYVQDAASVSPSSLSFGSETLKTQSAAKTVTLTNTAEIPLASISVSVTGDFHVINNCPSSLAAHASCSLGVTFTPTELGTRTGTLTVHDNWAGNAIHPQTVALSGTGIQ